MCCAFPCAGLKKGAWETMYFPANLGINMLYTTVLLETEPVMKTRLMQDLEEWMTLGQTHLQGSFAAFYLAAHAHARRQQLQPPQRQNDGGGKGIAAAPLTGVANGTVQALLLDMASMGPGERPFCALCLL